MIFAARSAVISAGTVENRSDFDHVAADEVQAGELADQLLRFVAREAANLAACRSPARSAGSTESMSNVT